MNSEEKFLGYNKKTLITVVSAIILLVGGFCVGTRYEKSKLERMGLLKTSAAAPQAKTTKSKTSNTVSGSISAKDDKTVTIKKDDNTIQVISVTASTKFGPDGKGTTADFKVGDNVSLSTTKNADGSLSAKSVKPVVVSGNASDGSAGAGANSDGGDTNSDNTSNIQ